MAKNLSSMIPGSFIIVGFRIFISKLSSITWPVVISRIMIINFKFYYINLLDVYFVCECKI